MQETVGDVAALVRRAREHDRAAFAEIYRLSITPVFRYVAVRVASAQDAEELTQAVFFAALNGIPTLRAEDEAGLMGWLFQIARNKLADHLRQRYRRPTAPLDDAADVEASQPRPEEAAEAQAERIELQQALEQLTPEQREVVICKYVLGYDNQRTARQVGKNVNAVNQLHHRALASLHRLLVGTERTR